MTDFTRASDLAFEVAKQTEESILAQLNDFISRGLLEIEMGPITFVSSDISMRVEVRQRVALKLKDKEYIQKLEAENKELRDLIVKIKGII